MRQTTGHRDGSMQLGVPTWPRASSRWLSSPCALAFLSSFLSGWRLPFVCVKTRGIGCHLCPPSGVSGHLHLCFSSSWWERLGHVTIFNVFNYYVNE